MKRALALVTLLLCVGCQRLRNDAQNELMRVEKEFAQAVLNNDAEAIGKFLSDDWVIIDADGRIIDKSHFLGVIKSGALVHEAFGMYDMTVRVCGDSAVVTTITSAEGKFMKQPFSSRERATDVFVMRGGRWQCVFSQLTSFEPKKDAAK
jgi:ketosteroid isomerase-like protein